MLLISHSFLSLSILYFNPDSYVLSELLVKVFNMNIMESGYEATEAGLE